MEKQPEMSADVCITATALADTAIDSAELKTALSSLPPITLPESKTYSFADYTLPLTTGEAALTLKDLKVTFVLARDTSGVEVCYQTLVFKIQTHMWKIGPPHPFHFFLNSLNSAGGVLDTWDVIMNEFLDCRNPGTPKSYKRAFEPNIYRVIEGAQIQFLPVGFDHCPR